MGVEAVGTNNAQDRSGDYHGRLTDDSAGPNDNLEGGYRGTAPAGSDQNYGSAVPYGKENSMRADLPLTNGLVHDQTTAKGGEGLPDGKKESRLTGRMHV